MITQQQQEGLISHPVLCGVHGVPVALGRALGDEGERALDPGQLLGLAQRPVLAGECGQELLRETPEVASVQLLVTGGCDDA